MKLRCEPKFFCTPTHGFRTNTNTGILKKVRNALCHFRVSQQLMDLMPSIFLELYKEVFEEYVVR